MARPLAADPFLNGAVELYGRVVTRAADGTSRTSDALAGSFCTVIRSVRRAQARETALERYDQEVLAAYRCSPALKDELRTAVKGLVF